MFVEQLTNDFFCQLAEFSIRRSLMSLSFKSKNKIELGALNFSGMSLLSNRIVIFFQIGKITASSSIKPKMLLQGLNLPML